MSMSGAFEASAVSSHGNVFGAEFGVASGVLHFCYTRLLDATHFQVGESSQRVGIH
jgi:hypothetical protein